MFQEYFNVIRYRLNNNWVNGLMICLMCFSMKRDLIWNRNKKGMSIKSHFVWNISGPHDTVGNMRVEVARVLGQATYVFACQSLDASSPLVLPFDNYFSICFVFSIMPSYSRNIIYTQT